MTDSMHDCGFAYVATGERYLREAAESAKSLRHTNPNRRICLITDKAVGVTPFWDDLVILDQPHFGFRDKIEMRRCPYRRFVYLDTDTHIVGDLSELFTILGQFDACGVQMFEGHDYRVEGMPYAYSETNSGMLGFQKNPDVEAFFEEWLRCYLEFRAQNTEADYHYANVGDQKSLRVALWNSRIRFAPVGGEFNFIPFRIDFASLPVKVLHTRNKEGLDQLSHRLNTVLGRRAYFPNLDVVISNDMPNTELRRLFLTSFRQLLRALVRKITPLAFRNYLRRSPSLKGWFLGNRHESSSKGQNKKWDIS